MSNFDNENEFFTPYEPPLENESVTSEAPQESEPQPEQSVEEQAIEEQPVEEQPIEEQPAEEKPIEEKPDEQYAFRAPAQPQYTAWKGAYYEPPRREPVPTSSVNFAPVDINKNTMYYPKKKKKNKTVIVLASLRAVCLIFSFIGIFASIKAEEPSTPHESDNQNTQSQVEIHDQATQETEKADGTLTVAGVSEKCVDSCVGITVYTKRTNYNNFYGFNYGSDSQSGEEVASGEGSGVLMLEANGRTYIMTCAHVISDGTSFVVTLNDKTEHRATLVGYDAQTDIGVLAINKTGLKIAEFADSDSTKQGEQVVAIGCPGGLQFLNSTTSGYVSALGRPISAIGYNMECIQVDAAINPGNSGGGLFNMQGQIIGINSSKIAATEYEGMGFAVPSNTAVATANSLIRVGYVEGRAMLGITYKAVTTYSNSDAILSALAQLGYENAEGTMVINEIRSDSDLATKDVRTYDMIVAVNGETLTSTDIMTSTLSNSKPGDTINLTIARIEGNQIDTFEITCELIENRG